MRLCKCGCGGTPKKGRKYIQYHHFKDPVWIENQRTKALNHLSGLSEADRYTLYDNSRKAMKHPDVIKNRSRVWKEKWKDPAFYKKMSGANAPNWLGGLSKKPYCKEFTASFKDEIREWDEFECRNPYCWETATRLAVHHIDYVKTNCHFNNLISVCTSCNIRANTHRKYWRRFYTRVRRFGFNERCMFEFGA